MLRNSFIVNKNHYLLKNNVYLTNIVISVTTIYLWKTLNQITINLLEKYFLEYFIKYIYVRLNVPIKLLSAFITQIFLFFILITVC